MWLTRPLRKNKNYTEQNLKLKSLEFLPKPFKRILFKNKEMIKTKELENIMREIEQYNIFYPKMLQSLPSNISAAMDIFTEGKKINLIGDILNNNASVSDKQSWLKRKLSHFTQDRTQYIQDNGIKFINDFLNNYKSSCPSSRTIKEAQSFIEKTYGKQYTILGEKPLGVGTIAESYLAKDNSTGKEVVIKMIKKWISVDKINADKDKMLASLTRVKDKMSKDDYDFQCKLVDELYKAWSKELNLTMEADAAKTLGKYAINYNTVAPISVKNNILVMEKAKGVQFDKFAEYLEKNNIKLSQDDMNNITFKYMQVFMEQLLSIPKKGEKIFHADPHAGNIFIDITNKEKPFTFIDTGNVMRFSLEDAIKNVTSHLDYLIGNSRNIAKKLLKDAILPNGMDIKSAEDLLTKHLDEIFFSGKYKIRTSDPFSTINTESMEFMKKHKIILNSKNTNFVKAELTYLMNLASVAKISKNVDINTILNEEQMKQNAKIMGKQILESIFNGIINNKKCTITEVLNRINYIEKNPEQFFTTLYTYVPPKA